MPLLAALIASIASGLVAILSRVMVLDRALKFASYTAWIAVFTAFAAAVFICVSGLNAALQGMFSAGAGFTTIAAGFGMGLGMFIPSNAATVAGCMGAVWIACQIYKIQTQGMHNYSK